MSLSLSDVAALPHWSRVEFARQCAEAVLPLYTRYAPMVEVEYVQTLERVLGLVAQSVAQQKSVDGLDAEYGAIWEAAGAVLVEAGEQTEEGSGAYTSDSVAASYVAKAVEMALETTLEEPGTSAQSAWSAFCFAWDAAEYAEDPAILSSLDRVGL